MMVFMCDICGKPFRYYKKNTNHIAFYTHHLSSNQYSETKWKNDAVVTLNPIRETDIAAYDCCPDCIVKITDLLRKIRTEEWNGVVK